MRNTLATTGGTMRVCGIELAASEARLVVLEGTKGDYSHLDLSPKKLTIANHEDPDEVRAFRDSVHAFLREHCVDKVAIKKRATRGDYAGGPVGFKLEGVIQLYEGCPVELVAAQTIAAAKRNYSPTAPASVRQYQTTAFECAFAALPRT